MDESVEEQDQQRGTGLAARGCGWIGCLLVIAIVIALGAGIYVLGNKLEPLADRYLWTPADLVKVYLAAYDEGDTARARSFLCSAVKGGQALDPGAPFGVTSSSAFVEDQFPYPRDNGQIAIYYAVRIPGFSTPRRAQALLVREDAGWRICSFRQ